MGSASRCLDQCRGVVGTLRHASVSLACFHNVHHIGPTRLHVRERTAVEVELVLAWLAGPLINYFLNQPSFARLTAR